MGKMSENYRRGSSTHTVLNLRKHFEHGDILKVNFMERTLDAMTTDLELKNKTF